MPGVIERVIENWLTSSNERSYQIPFCQLLAAEGETVIYISSHGPFEQGKDVVTIDEAGRPRGYQLKCGDVGLSEWRKYKGEINDLVELPIGHPAVRTSGAHIPFLVTNGEINDPAISAIRSSNEAWRRRRHPALRTISKGQLLKRFLAVHGSYLPSATVASPSTKKMCLSFLSLYCLSQIRRNSGLPRLRGRCPAPFC
jgi:hypothetical protein